MWSENPALSNFTVKNISFRLNKKYHFIDSEVNMSAISPSLGETTEQQKQVESCQVMAQMFDLYQKNHKNSRYE